VKRREAQLLREKKQEEKQRLEHEAFLAANPSFPLMCGQEPTSVWKILQATSRSEPVPFTAPPFVDGTSPQAPATTRFVVISDTHDRHTKMAPLPQGDVLIHCGDFTMDGRIKAISEFGKWFSSQPHPYKIVIAGNHDTTLDGPYYERAYHKRPRGSAPAAWKALHHRLVPEEEARAALLASGGVTYLVDQATTINGLTIYGSPWQPSFHDWAFNRDRGIPLRDTWALIPAQVDVLCTHGPALGHGDGIAGPEGDTLRTGCEDLLYAIQRVQPQVHVFGHVHEGYGATTDGTTVYANCSTCTFAYRPENPPVVFDLHNK